VKITIMFRGREVTHPELGRRILDEIAERVVDYAKVEAYPRLDGRNMTMVLGPDSKKKQKKRPAPQSTAGDGQRPELEPTENGSETAASPVGVNTEAGSS
jgi:translation initiation factor IF-3